VGNPFVVEIDVEHPWNTHKRVSHSPPASL
jgi:hypothetical protein